MKSRSVTPVFARRWCRKSCTRHWLCVYIFLLNALAIGVGTVIDSTTAHRSCELLTVGVGSHSLSRVYENLDQSPTCTPRSRMRRRANSQTTLTSTSKRWGKKVSMRRTSSVTSESSSISVSNTSSSDRVVRHIACRCTKRGVVYSFIFFSWYRLKRSCFFFPC